MFWKASFIKLLLPEAPKDMFTILAPFSTHSSTYRRRKTPHLEHPGRPFAFRWVATGLPRSSGGSAGPSAGHAGRARKTLANLRKANLPLANGGLPGRGLRRLPEAADNELDSRAGSIGSTNCLVPCRSGAPKPNFLKSGFGLAWKQVFLAVGCVVWKCVGFLARRL